MSTLFFMLINTAFQILVGVQIQLASHRIGPSSSDSPCANTAKDNCRGRNLWLKSGGQVKDTGEQVPGLLWSWQFKALRGAARVANGGTNPQYQLTHPKKGRAYFMVPGGPQFSIASFAFFPSCHPRFLLCPLTLARGQHQSSSPYLPKDQG